MATESSASVSLVLVSLVNPWRQLTVRKKRASIAAGPLPINNACAEPFHHDSHWSLFVCINLAYSRLQMLPQMPQLRARHPGVSHPPTEPASMFDNCCSLSPKRALGGENRSQSSQSALSFFLPDPLLKQEDQAAAETAATPDDEPKHTLWTDSQTTKMLKTVLDRPRLGRDRGVAPHVSHFLQPSHLIIKQSLTEATRTWRRWWAGTGVRSSDD